MNDARDQARFIFSRHSNTSSFEISQDYHEKELLELLELYIIFSNQTNLETFKTTIKTKQVRTHY